MWMSATLVVQKMWMRIILVAGLPQPLALGWKAEHRRRVFWRQLWFACPCAKSLAALVCSS